MILTLVSAAGKLACNRRRRCHNRDRRRRRRRRCKGNRLRFARLEHKLGDSEMAHCQWLMTVTKSSPDSDLLPTGSTEGSVGGAQLGRMLRQNPQPVGH
jgi:hypothetical protein